MVKAKALIEIWAKIFHSDALYGERKNAAISKQAVF